MMCPFEHFGFIVLTVADPEGDDGDDDEETTRLQTIACPIPSLPIR